MELELKGIAGNVITGVAVALLTTVAYWLYDKNTIDTELEVAATRIEKLEQIATQNAVLAKQNSANLEGLNSDRAIVALDNAYRTQQRLERKYGGLPPDSNTWDYDDQSGYEAAQVAIESAKKRPNRQE